MLRHEAINAIRHVAPLGISDALMIFPEETMLVKVLGILDRRDPVWEELQCGISGPQAVLGRGAMLLYPSGVLTPLEPRDRRPKR